MIQLDNRVGLMGDAHGSGQFIFNSFSWFHKRGVKDVVQLGDFWYYEPLELVKLSRMAKKFDINFHFIDGNHEFFPFLNEKAEEAKIDGKPQPVELWEKVTYLPRGVRGSIGDKTFLAMGGAVSIDREYRVMGESWFFEEVPSKEDVDNGTIGDPVDILLTHDIPNECRSPYTVNKFFGEGIEADKRLYNDRITEVYRYHQPELVAHGHYHKFYEEEITNYSGREHKVIGLGADIALRGSVVIIGSDLSLEEVRI